MDDDLERIQQATNRCYYYHQLSKKWVMLRVWAGVARANGILEMPYASAFGSLARLLLSRWAIARRLNFLAYAVGYNISPYSGLKFLRNRYPQP